jgi:Holliday junction resolvasome RuvABC endonuclease subunit
MRDLSGQEKRTVLGIDPGLGETGLVLFECDGEDSEVLEIATYSASKKGDIIERTDNLAGAIENTLCRWCRRHDIGDLLIGIEIPIIRGHAGKSNLDVYRKQVQLLYLLETLLLDLPVDNVRIVEVNPTESKKVLTGRGDADKSEMVDASPFYGVLLTHTRGTAEALADAYAHGLAALNARVDGNYFVTGNRSYETLEPNMEESWS